MLKYKANMLFRILIFTPTTLLVLFENWTMSQRNTNIIWNYVN